jgi:hypothetical protein
MTIISSWNYDNAGGFSHVLGATERLGFSNENAAVKPISVNGFNPYTMATNAAFNALVNLANNCQYIDATHVSLNGLASTPLDVGNVAQSDCTVRVDWQDDAGNTVLSNCAFYAFDGVVAANPPSNILILAFERTASALRKDRIGGAAGKAWDASFGVGGSANALSLADQVSASNHQFWIGISASPTAYGTHTGIVLRVEFDVS